MVLKESQIYSFKFGNCVKFPKIEINKLNIFNTHLVPPHFSMQKCYYADQTIALTFGLNENILKYILK